MGDGHGAVRARPGRPVPVGVRPLSVPGQVFDAVVAGAGIVGCATAYELARRGTRVRLIDRGELSSGTTGLGEGNVLCCDKEAGPELGLARLGLALFDEIEELLGAEAGIRRKGALVLFGEEAAWEAEQERLASMRAEGVECAPVGPGELRELEPELRGDLAGASLFPGDLQCAPRAIARGLAREAEALGAVVTEHVQVERITVEGGRVAGVETAEGRVPADVVVLAAGTWSAPLAASAGLALPLEPRKGQLVRLERRPGFFRHKLIDGSYMAAVSAGDAGLHVSTVMENTLDGHVLVGSSRERRGFDLSVDPAVSDALLDAAARLAPGIRGLAAMPPGPGCGPGSPTACPPSGPRARPTGCSWARGTRARAWRMARSRAACSRRRSAASVPRSTWRRSTPTASRPG